MPSTPFHHPYRIDEATIQRATGLPGLARLLQTSQLPESLRFLTIDPTVFTHAYLLLAEHPQRFDDLSYYLSTIRTFFERSDATGGIRIPAAANADVRRRLCEDLGVGLASYFMVELFGVTWETICQIPQNTKLSTKRPDFEGFSTSSQRYLFEAKGTTGLSRVEAFLSKAIDQVKDYPEEAEAKVAIVSYISADERFFPSTSFVVDPPSLPQGVESDPETSRLLHFEKILQYIGLAALAKNYLQDLSKQLAEEHRDKEVGAISWGGRLRPTRLRLQLTNAINEQLVPMAHPLTVAGEGEFVGRFLRDSITGFDLFLGVARSALEAGIQFASPERKVETQLLESDTELTSVFSDGTVLRMSRREINQIVER